MSIAPYLTLITEVLPVHRRDFYVANPALLNPGNANPIVDGEWLTLDTAYKAIRGAGEAAVPSWQVFAERGRYDTQAIGKVPLLFLGGYEAETKVANLTGMDVGDGLVVADVTFQSLTRRGMAVLGAGAGNHLIFGYVTRVFSDRVRYWYPGVPTWKAVA